ncbi:MAG: hypothetical protein IJ614_02040 [Prevotella sp.]|nr:hypothetical protein [Prevotella sp.]
MERLHASGSMNKKEFDSIMADNNEIIYILISIIKTMKEKNKNTNGLGISLDKNGIDSSNPQSNHNF